jgi:hypothetical protein
MHLEFQLTLDELVESQFRLLSHAKPMAAMRRRNLVGGSVLCGALSALGPYFVMPESPVRLAWTTASGLTGLMMFAFMEPAMVKRRLRRLCRLQTDVDGALHVSLDISPSGIIERSPANQLALDWAQVEEIIEQPSFVDLFGNGSVITIPDRAFTSPSHRAELVEEAMLNWRKTH